MGRKRVFKGFFCFVLFFYFEGLLTYGKAKACIRANETINVVSQRHLERNRRREFLRMPPRIVEHGPGFSHDMYLRHVPHALALTSHTFF